MRYLIVYTLFCIMFLTGCGQASVNNELVGQVKRVVNRTPLICPNRSDVDVSLGVFKNGTGSMSTRDMWLTVQNQDDVKKLNTLAASGALVKITYDVERLVLCPEDHWVTKVEAAN